MQDFNDCPSGPKVQPTRAEFDEVVEKLKLTEDRLLISQELSMKWQQMYEDAINNANS